jgi:hypothetical protein
MAKVSYNTAGYTKEQYDDKLRGLSDDDLRKEVEQFVWLSAFANNNPRSAYHWMVDMTYDEAKRRDNIDIYRVAYDNVFEGEHGDRPSGTKRQTFGKEA